MSRRERDRAGGSVGGFFSPPQYVNRGVVVTATQSSGSPTYFVNGNYEGYRFTGSGDFVVSNGTLRDVEFILVAGGGSGGYNNPMLDVFTGGGGGAGGLVRSDDHSKLSLVSGTYPVVIGAGGAAPVFPYTANNGNNSRFANYTAFGGGHGDGSIGGSGGGGGGRRQTDGSLSLGNGTASFLTPQGKSGGNAGGFISSLYGGGGGGGYSTSGTTATSTASGAGGSGLTITFDDQSRSIAGGGGGGMAGSSGRGLGADGGGNGNGGGSTAATAGTANTGGGGGGYGSAGGGSSAAAGGSGVFMIRWPR